MLESLPNDMLAAAEYSRDIGERILLALSEPYDLAGHQHECTCSIGVTLFSKRKQNMGDLLKQADLAVLTLLPAASGARWTHVRR